MDLVGGDFRCRLVGSEVVRRAGRDVTGEMLDPEKMPERAVPAFVMLLRRAAESPAPVIYSAGSGTGSSHSALGILLPLVDKHGHVEMILGGLFYETMRGLTAADSWMPGALVALPLAEMLENHDGARLR